MKKVIYSLAILCVMNVTSFAQSITIVPNASGNVGIRNINPQNLLQIGPTTSPAFLGNDLAIGNAAGGGMSLFQSGAASTGNSIWYSNSNFALIPAFGGTGNVGINLISPTAKLEIFGTGPVKSGWGSFGSPLRAGLAVTGSHAVANDNYNAIGIAAFAANANAATFQNNIGVLSTTGSTGNNNICFYGYQNASFTGTVMGTYNEVVQTGTGTTHGSFNRITNSESGTNNGVYAEVTSSKASGFLSNFGVTSVVTSAAANTSAANYGYYANVTGAGTNYGIFASASGGVSNYAVAAYGNSFFENNVAIGTTSIPALPLAKLVVTGFQGTSTGTSSYFNPGSAIYTQVTSGANLSVYAPHGIVSNLYIGAALSVTASDNRIKKDFSLSNNSEDLARLRKIEITNYRMKDAATWGNQTFKKVIAQQVESVYPEVIKTQTQVIPDIYALADSVVYDAVSKKLSILLLKDYGMKIGEKIELVHPEKGKIISEVIAVSGKSFTVKDWNYPTDKIFVFGREVNDFRSVDYEALSMLGISAIQALAKENEEMKVKMTKLETQNTDFQKLKERLDIIEANLKSLNNSSIIK